MNAKSWKDVAELFGIAAIVVSLVFVGLQLRQDQIVAHAELGVGTFIDMVAIDQKLTDTEFAATYMKMLHSPVDLSEEEMVSVNAFLDQVVLAVSRDCYLLYVGIYDECDGLAGHLSARFFGNTYAKVWWHTTKYRRRQSLVAKLTPVIDSQSNEESIRIYEEIRKQL